MATIQVESTKKEEDAVVEEADVDMNAMTEDSNLADPSRRICIVTTAALPWMTGTAVNPLLRALYLTRDRPKGYVTLMIPWLEDAKERTKLYGPDRNFESSSDQEDWIRDFCRTRANCVEEEKNLRIHFYDSVYHPAFGSIFPLVDICSLIPVEEADIAILEEPEHLNWLRVPNESESTNKDDENHPQKLSIEQKHEQDKEQLGWTYKFRHVVGILHTNYGAYMKDYAIGTSIIAAPAIGMLSSTVVRAYCHQVIRLSAVLPSLAPNKEVTCNVHGVRSEFLDRAEPSTENSSETFAAVYFIGKLIWAKGFDKVLDLQERYKTDTGEYFAMDIYGGGNDEIAITRAFYGRKGKPPSEEERKRKIAEQEAAVKIVPSKADIKAASVFSSQISLKRVISETSHKAAEEQSFEVVQDAAGGDELDISEVGVRAGARVEEIEESHPLEIIGDISTTSFFTGLSASQAVYCLGDSMVKAGLTMSFTEGPSTDGQESSDSSSVEADNTGMKEENKKAEKKKEKKKKTKPFFFDPPQSRFEWRRYAIPANFLGVRDHAMVRDITEHKIFLNMSITEVLCTTTAEALAMGKFVIIPKHPSNTFFLQFPNCLAYETVKECVEKLKWALENDPTPLTDEYFHRFTWEGANERLFKSAAITRKEAKHRVVSGQDKADLEVAWLHIETTKTGRIVHNFFALPSGATTPRG